MAAFSLPPASTLEQHEMAHGAGVLRIVSQDGSERPQRKRNAPRSRSRKPTEEINFLAQLEQRGVEGPAGIPRQDDVFALDPFFAPDQRLSTPDVSQRISAPLPAGKRSRPQPEPSKRTRPPAKKAKPQGEPRVASQRQRGVLLVKAQTRPTRGSAASLSVKPVSVAVVGDDSATESEGQMVRRGMASAMELRDQGGAAAATVGGGKSSSGTSHTVSSSGNDTARAEAILERKKALKGIAASFREECVQLSRTVLAFQRQWKQELQTPHPGLGTADPPGENGSANPQASSKSRPRDKRVVPPLSRRKPASRTIVTYDPTRNLIAEV